MTDFVKGPLCCGVCFGEYSDCGSCGCYAKCGGIGACCCWQGKALIPGIFIF